MEGLPALVAIVGLSVLLLVRLGPIARRVGLVDRPSERKTHGGEVPAIGGIAIYLSFVMALTLVPFGLTEHRTLIFASGLLMIVGVLDDYNDIRPSTKVLAQIAAAIVLVYMGDVFVPSIGDIFGWDNGNEQGLGSLARLLSIFAIVAMINAFNMIDGHDGLLSGIVLIVIVCVAAYCGVSGNWKAQFTLLLLFLPVAVFFLFNLGIFPRKVGQSFLGDAGSMFLALIIAYLVIALTNEDNAALRRVQVPWILGLPIFDMIAVLFDRLKSRRSLVAADRRHIHHLLLRRGYSASTVLVILLFIHLCLSAIGILAGLFQFPDRIIFWSLIPALGGYLLFRDYLTKRRGEE
jgi:UDP-GlcNAc:undecaprenyl-phosphate GlcNAc-1-phosphate transferase